MLASIRNHKIFGFLVWGLCVLFFLYEFFLRTVIGTFQHPLMNDLELSSMKFSMLSTTAYMLIYGMMQIPVSLCVDRYGLKKSLIIGAIACSIASFGLAKSTHFYSAVGFRMIMGFGSSFGFICLLISVYDWMPRRFNGLFIGISQFLGTMGPLIAAGPLHAVSESSSVSWRNVFLGMSGVGVLLTFLIALFVENNHEKKGAYTVLRKPEGLFANIKRLFKSTQPWMITIFCASVYFSIEYLSENEGISFIISKGFSKGFASTMISLSWLGFAIGNPALGLASDLLKRRKLVMAFCSVVCVIAVFGIIYSSNETILGLAFLLLGVSASGQSIGVAAMSDQFKKHFIAIGYGLNNAVVTSVVAVNAPVLGFFLDLNKKGLHPTEVEYATVFNSLIGISGLALLVSVFLIKESFCKSQVDYTFLNTK